MGGVQLQADEPGDGLNAKWMEAQVLGFAEEGTRLCLLAPGALRFFFPFKLDSLRAEMGARECFPW